MPIIQSLGSSSAQGFGSFGIGTRTQGPTTLGEFWQGGYYAGKIAFGGNTYYLLVSPAASGQSQQLWATTPLQTSLGLSTYDGATNTSELNSATFPAAQWCAGLTINGYSDWYLPALYELEICYYNLKPTTDNNVTTVGSNAYAVPARGSNYTTSVPGQTSVVAFREGNSEAFASGSGQRTWTSTNPSSTSTSARRITMDDGTQATNDKDLNYYVRAIRKVLV